uniref:Uncharacterized protein n=1 Tax=Peronospora matthiolae TaxID=2874970 RepID=A0AAV1U3G2_9STRA
MVLTLAEKTTSTLQNQLKVEKMILRVKEPAASDASGKASAVCSSCDFVHTASDAKVLGDVNGSTTAARIDIDKALTLTEF